MSPMKWTMNFNASEHSMLVSLSARHCLKMLVWFIRALTTHPPCEGQSRSKLTEQLFGGLYTCQPHLFKWDEILIIGIDEMPAFIRGCTMLISPVCSTPNGSMEVGFIRKNRRNGFFLQCQSN